MEEVPFHKPLRLSEYDYSLAGYYFITICVKDKQWILWEEPTVAANCVRLSRSVAANCVRPTLSPLGKVVENEISVLAKTYEGLFVDKFVIMPNHLHLIIGIRTKDRRSQCIDW
jgi:putative transposase